MTVVDNVLMFDSPIQIMVVLLIALVVFGPKRLPEIGKQIGSALRELRKATGDVMNSFNTDYEPDPDPHLGSTESASHYEPGSYSRPTALAAPVDLTDYTIVGAAPAPAAAPDDMGDVYRLAATPATGESAGPVARDGAAPDPAAAAVPHSTTQGEPDA